MKKIILASVLVPLSLCASAQVTDTWNAGFTPNSNGAGSTRVWSGPGWSYSAAAAARGATVSAGTGGLTVLETRAVALGDGRAVTLAASRFASNSNIFAALGALARGPYGLVATLALPYVVEWIAGDGGTNIRLAPGGQSLEKKDQTVCLTNCRTYQYSTCGVSPVYQNLAAACAGMAAAFNAHVCGGALAGFTVTASTPYPSATCTVTGTNYGSYYSSGATGAPSAARNPDAGTGWIPASMDDIAPYMTPRVPPVASLSQLANAGQAVDVTPVSVTTVSAPPSLAPYVTTTTYPKPADKTTTITTIGNPFNLPNNTPTITGSATSSAPLNPGPTSITGVSPTGTPAPAPAPVVTPTQTTTTSTFNPTTNATTSISTTAQDAAQRVSTSTTTTTINNTTNTSTATYNTTNITNLTNTTTMTPLEPTKTDTSDQPAPTPAAPTELNTCGLPGLPACKIDEGGTPTYQPPIDPTIAGKAAELAKITTITAAPALFVGWSALFDAPAISLCTPFVLPRDMGSLDPCPVVDGVRSVMGYIWALTAMFLCLGMIKKAV